MTWQTKTVAATATLVSTGLAITGLLWFQRGAPTVIKTVDVLELIAGAIERADATQYAQGSNVASSATNYVRAWIPDTTAPYWYSYATNGARITNTYLTVSGSNAVVTTSTTETGYGRRVAKPTWNTPYAEHGTNRHVWGGYSNLTAIGFDQAAANQVYTWSNRVDWINQEGGSAYIGTHEVADYYSGTNGWTLLILNAPSDAARALDYSCRLLDNAGVLYYYAEPYHAAHHGPWWRDDVGADYTSGVMTAANLISNMLRDAWCAETGVWVNAITPINLRAPLKAVRDTVVSCADGATSYYLTSNDTYNGFVDLNSAHVTLTGLQAQCGITATAEWASVWNYDTFATNKSIVRTNDFNETHRMLSALRYTHVGSDRILWSANGETNQLTWSGDSGSSWGDAVNAARASEPVSNVVNDVPLGYVNAYRYYSGGTWYWHVDVVTRYAYPYTVGISTNTTHEGMVYVRGDDALGADTNTYNDFSTGISNGTVVAWQALFPGTWGAVADGDVMVGEKPARWIEPPASVEPVVTNLSYAEGWKVDMADIALTWTFTYCTNAL